MQNGFNQILHRAFVTARRTLVQTVCDDAADRDGVVAHHRRKAVDCRAFHLVVGDFLSVIFKSCDFIVDFARVMPGVPKAQVKSRVILAPEHAKRLLGALQENIFRYEREFGPIKIPNQQDRTIAPFDASKGEA